VKLQLLIFLFKLSSSGTGEKFSMIDKFHREEKNVLTILCHIRLPNGIGIIDGTLLFLTETPEWSGEDFNTQKGGYGLNALVVCDDQCCVT
jgi:hypothetical protein